MTYRHCKIGATALWISVYKAHYTVAEKLAAKGGCTVNIASFDGISPLLLSLVRDLEGTRNLMYLLFTRSNIFAELILYRRIDILHMFLEKQEGSSLAAGFADNNTLMHLAIYSDCEKMVQFVFDKVGWTDSQNSRGLTPLQLAVKRGQVGVINVLKKRLEKEICWSTCNNESLITGLSQVFPMFSDDKDRLPKGLKTNQWLEKVDITKDDRISLHTLEKLMVPKTNMIFANNSDGQSTRNQAWLSLNDSN